MPEEQSNIPIKFKIKLLSGNNVVLVDCVGYESELFMPQIVKGRITFQNIIPSHRCCDAAAANVQTDQLILPACSLGDVRILAGVAQAQSNTSTPLVRRTPSLSAFVRNLSRSGKENVTQQLTPEIVRCCLPATSPLNNMNKSDIRPNMDLSVELQPVTELPFLNETETTSSIKRLSTISNSSGPHSVYKAPPVRTYERRKPNGQAKAPISWSPLHKKKSTKISSTKPPSPRVKLDVRRRKLLVDQKRSLGTQKIHKTATPAITKAKIRSTQVSGKTRQQFEALKGTAFDMLTTSSLGTLSDALTQQFRDACVDKFSDALPKYAELSEAAPLQMDRQVKTLIAKRKRLDKKLTKSQRENMIKGKSQS